MLVRGGRLVDPSQDVDARRDVRISGGVVAEIGEHLSPSDDDEVVEAEGAIVAPGFIDMHVHLREPGFSEKETIATGAQAAARGGFTAVACMPNTDPPIDRPAVVAEVLALAARQRFARVYPIATITRGRAGLEPVDFSALARAGAVAFSDDGDTIADVRVLHDAAVLARDVAGVFISHCEEPRLKGAAVMNEGDVSRELGLPGSPALAEEVIVGRDLLVGMQTGKAWHIAHLSTRGALAILLDVRARGSRATCEVTPHHLSLTDAAVRELGSGAKVNPPLRAEADARALRDAVRDGTIDAFATDHAPHAAPEKAGDIARAAVGFSGLEIAVGAYAAALPDLPLSRFVALLSTNPARILGVPGGSLAVGSPADVTLLAERTWTVDPSTFASKGKSTPFAGCVFQRRAVATILGGALRYCDASVRE
ncbi:MAG: dihydroorotase [Vulcanimicrobiaceae bacterium]